MEEAVAASGPMSTLAQARAASALAQRMPPVDVDTAALTAELEALLA